MLSGKGRPRASEDARTGIAGFVVGGGVLAALQILQQVVGVFDPREIVTILIAVAVALATTAAAKWRARRLRDENLNQELRVWPLPLLKDADPLVLGVWPEREHGQDPQRSLAEDAEREAEEGLGRALVESPFVLVYGPPRAGKSRTATNAARNALGETPVIVPRGPDAFEALLDRDLQLELHGRGVVLWLDGLERYAHAIDGTRLDELAGIGGGAKIIATIRTGEWDALLDASGQLGEAAKAITARARPFKVTDETGIAAERSASGKDEGTPALAPAISKRALARPSGFADRWLARPAARSVAVLRGLAGSLSPTLAGRGAGLRSGWRDPWLVLSGAGSLAVVLALGVLASLGEFKKSIPPPIPEQVRDIRGDATRGDPGTVQDDRHAKLFTVDLQGDGEKSYVLNVEDGADRDGFFELLGEGDPRRPTSNELRVYDIEDGRLREKFRFQPDNTGGDAALFELRGIGDVDEDQADELIGGYGLYGDNSSQAQIPFALDWDDAEGSYRIVPLELQPPALPRRGFDPRLEPLFAAYSGVITLRDTDTGTELSGYRAQDFAVDPKPVFRLLAGYFLEYPNERHDGVMRLEPYQFRSGAPSVRPCEISEQEVRAVVPNGGSREKALLTEWEKISRQRNCEPLP